jgi:hypothetical protein
MPIKNFTTTGTTFSIVYDGLNQGTWDRLDELDSKYDVDIRDSSATLSLRNPGFSDVLKVGDTLQVNGVELVGTFREKMEALKNQVLYLSSPGSSLPTETLPTYAAMTASIASDPTTKRDFFVSADETNVINGVAQATQYYYNGTTATRIIDELSFNAGLTKKGLSTSAFNLRNTWAKINSIGQNTGTARLRMLVFGDSVAFAKPDLIRKALRSNYTEVGRGMNEMGFSSAAGGAVINTGDFSNWISGNTATIPAGGEVVLSLGTTLAVYGDTIKLFYVKSSGAGTFKVQTSFNGGAYADEASYTNVSAVNATTIGSVITLSKTLGTYKIKVVGLTGTVVIIGAEISNSTVPGFIFNDLSNGGKSLVNFNSCPQAILTPILSSIGADLCFFELKDTAQILTDELSNFQARSNTAIGTNTDWVYVGSNPIQTGDDDQVAQNVIIKKHAQDNGFVYYDGYTPLGSYTIANAAGLMSDGTHPNTSGYTYVASLMFKDLFLSNNLLSQQWQLDGRARLRYRGKDIFSYGLLGDTSTQPKANLLSGLNSAMAVGGVLTPDSASFPAMWCMVGGSGSINSIWGEHYTNLTRHLIRVASVPYNQSNLPPGVFFVDNQSTTQDLHIGGGSTGLLAGVTSIRFRASSAVNTAQGTVMASIDTNGLHLGDLTGPLMKAGTGSPEGVVTAPVGSIYTRTDGGAGTTLYIKESGTGNTGWIAK